MSKADKEPKEGMVIDVMDEQDGAHQRAGRGWQHVEQLQAEAAGGAGRSSACGSSLSHHS